MWTRAKFNPLRRFKPNGVAVDIWGRNRYTRVPVSPNGLNRTAHAFQEWVNDNYPDTPTKTNYAVDRNMRGSQSLSRHAEGTAGDVITQKWDGKLGISKGDLEWGRRVFNAVVANMQAGTPTRNWDGRWYSGTLRTTQVIFDGQICKASEGCRVRPLNPGSLMHRDHLHWDGASIDRAASTRPPKESRRTLRYRKLRPVLYGEDVGFVQAVVGTKITGSYDAVTAAAVRIYQRRHNLIVDGVVGPQTWARIDIDTEP